MAAKNSGNALLHLRTLFNVGAIGALSDGQLLERFATGRGEPRELAFAALVEPPRAVCPVRLSFRPLCDENAAEDAFQATFLALARKAGSLWAQDSLAPWLHQAAYRACGARPIGDDPGAARTNTRRRRPARIGSATAPCQR